MSLRDQLLKAGLVTEKQAKQAAQQQARPQSRHKPPTPSPQQQAVQQAQALKAARDQELNLKKQQKAERKALAAQVNQLVEQYRLPRIESDDAFSFVDRSAVKRIAVDAQSRARLLRGELMIVRYRGHHALVPSTDAERIRERDANALISLAATPPTSPDPDDPYREFVVPDDLTW